jgi:hypothetical protein
VVVASRPALDAAVRLGLGIAAGWLIAILAALALAFFAVVCLALVKADDGNIGKREGVAENVSLLSAVPPPAGTVLTATTSEPIASPGGFRTRISGYVTWLSYTAPRGTSREEVSTHYLAAFDRAGWDFVGSDQHGECYVLGEARACLERGVFRVETAGFAIRVTARPIEP